MTAGAPSVQSGRRLNLAAPGRDILDAVPAADSELLRRIAAGDTAAFEDLYAGYASRLLAFALRVTRTPELVDEVVNDTLLAIWRSASRFEHRSSASTWIFGIAYRKALHALAARRRHPTGGEAPDASADTRPPADERLERRESLATLGRALSDLSAEQRAVVELTFVQGLTYAEVAAAIDCPVNTVKTRMFHARRKLRAALDRAGLARPHSA